MYKRLNNRLIAASEAEKNRRANVWLDDADNLPHDDVLRQAGEPTRAERAVIAEEQRRACGFISASEIAAAQRKLFR